MAVTSTITSPAGTPHRSSQSHAKPNVDNVVLGNLHIKPWYPSFYPEDLIGGRRADWLYVCRWCFRYTSSVIEGQAHGKVCPEQHETPPGDVIYEKDGYAVYKLDGEDHKLYAQDLCLFSKLFLDTKSVFFDVSTFLYYTLVQLPSKQALSEGANPHGQVVGFFSKEKMSWDNNNVACILVFPPWQRRGLGQILMAVSYELGKREGRFGGPERPLSTLGRKGYIGFWCGEVARCLLSAETKKTVSIKQLSDETWILQEDIAAALKEMGVAEGRKTASGRIVVNKSKVRQWADEHGVGREPLIDMEAFAEEETIDSEDEEHSEAADSDAEEENELSD